MYDSIDELMARLSKMTGDVEASVKKGVLRGCQKVQADAERLCQPGKDGSGYLRNSITADVKNEGDDIVGTVGTSVKYGAYVEFGTGPVGAASPKLEPPGVNLVYNTGGRTYERISKKGKEFKTHVNGWFYKNEDGNIVYTEGQPAKPFLYPAFKQNEQFVKDTVAKAVSDALGGE